MSAIRVTLKAVSLGKEGRTICDLGCNGQEVRVVFTGEDVLIEVHEPAEENRDRPC